MKFLGSLLFCILWILWFPLSFIVLFAGFLQWTLEAINPRWQAWVTVEEGEGEFWS